jgi:outer membrane protein, multidrug efflux system
MRHNHEMSDSRRVMGESVQRRLFPLAVAPAVAGHILGADYRRPEVPLPTDWRAPAAGSGSLADLRWWQPFQDPVLQELINIALGENKDLRVAVARVAEARAQLGIARAAGWSSCASSRFRSRSCCGAWAGSGHGWPRTRRNGESPW